jgi:Condensation domain
VSVRTLEAAPPSGRARGASPLAPGQEGEWELMKELYPDEPGCARNLVCHSRYLHGPLDLRAMERAFGDVTRRHDSLRLVLESIDVDPRVRLEEDVEPPVQFLDLSRFGEEKQRSLLRELVYRERRRSFDLQSAPAWHAWFVRLGRTTHLLNFTVNHLVADGWSSKVFVTDLLTAYGARVGTAAAPDEPAPGFAELSALQARRRAPTPERLRYWRERLAPVPRWPFAARPKPDADMLARQGVEFALPRQTAARMKAVAWRARTTPYVVMLAGYHLLLSLRTGKPRTVIHIVTRERPTKVEQRAIFLCAGYPYVATDTPPEATLHEVIRATDVSMQEATDNQIPYKDLARAVDPSFDTRRPWSPSHLFDGDFTSWAYDEPTVELAGLRVTERPVPEARPAGYASDRSGRDFPHGLPRPWEFRSGPNLDISTYRDGGAVGFDPDVYSAEEMQRLADEYLWVMETLVWRHDVRVESLRAGHARRFGS